MSQPWIVVTGGAGFIGSQLVKRLRVEFPDHNIHIIDNLSHSLMNNLWGFDGTIDTSTLSGRNASYNLPHTENIVAIFHLAALSNTASDSIEELIDQNVSATESLIKFAQSKGIPMIYASSASVYGNQLSPTNEQSPMQPISLYGLSKMLVDCAAKRYMTGNVPLVGLRYFNVYGPGEEHKIKSNSCSPILKFYKELREFQEVDLFAGSKQFFRDFIHVDQAVEVTIAAYKKGATGIFNVGNGYSESFYDIAATVADELNLDISACVRWKIMSEEMESRYQSNTCADMTKTKKELVDCTDSSLKNVKSYVQYLKEEYDG